MVKYDLYFDEDSNKFVAVNPETGEVKELVEAKKKTPSKKKAPKQDENPNPQITLEANKFCLNTAAVELLGVEPGDRIVIHYLHGDPIVGKSSAFNLASDAGNKMTQSNSVSCRGKGNEELSKHGSVFDLIATDKEGQFRMKGDAPELPKETEEIANPDDVDDIDDLISEEEASDVPFEFNL